MRLSFDLDDTLILTDRALPTEPQRVPWLLRGWLDERVRAGTVRLMAALRERDVEVVVYTTSERSPRYVRWLLRWYGARVAHVVNAAHHRAIVSLHGFPAGRPPSKYPPALDIDLHVDDSPGVAEEGATHGFYVLVIAPDDPDWVEAVLARVDGRVDGLG